MDVQWIGFQLKSQSGGLEGVTQWYRIDLAHEIGPLFNS